MIVSNSENFAQYLCCQIKKNGPENRLKSQQKNHPNGFNAIKLPPSEEPPQPVEAGPAGQHVGHDRRRREADAVQGEVGPGRQV